jgi:hypothetical protein
VPEHEAFPDGVNPLIGRRAQSAGSVPSDREIRLTYGELTQLIEDAIRDLK